MEISEFKDWFSKHRTAILDDYFHFLRFKTIATDPQYHRETKECAQWLVSYLNQIGLEAETWETSGQPIVFATHCKAGDDRPTLLVYHHYDVQPVDPLELWESPPFEPTMRNGKVYARGAQDNKGQCFYSITAMKALLELCKQLRFNLKVFIEGEEESGSCGTAEIFEKKAQELKSDHLLVVDSMIPDPGIPAITLGSRGILTAEVTCKTANGDMHSGALGGIAYNPNRALIIALSTLWDKEGKVTVAHFYDDVVGLSPEEVKEFEIEVDEESVKKKFGLRAFCPEPGFTLGQSASIRPTLEINGIGGGYTGEGFKTVIPAVAKAKISCRLVPHQNPQKIGASLKEHLLKHVPKGLELDIVIDQGSAAFRARPDSLIAKLASRAYEEVMGKPCKNIILGGSLPIIVELAKYCQADTVMMGYGLDTDQIHAPNEHFGLDRFEQGFLTMGSIFSKLNES